MAQSDSISESASHIAAQLGETEPVPLTQIKRMILRLGLEQVQAFVDEAIARQRDGGMTIDNGDQQRTLGGIFFKIAKNKVKSSDRYFIWLRGQTKNEKKPRFQWTDRLQIQADLAQQPGEAITVKVTLVGRPGKIVERGDVVITSMSNDYVPSLSKQLPKVPDNAVTNYVIFIAKKQWKKVAEAIKDPADKLVIEGYPVVDAKMRGITVFAQSATTKFIQQAKKQ